MSYKPVYPNIGDEVLPFDKGQEDRVGSAINEIVDYVIESGSNTHGYWEKWKSGKLLMWGVTMASEAGKDLTHVTPMKFTGDTSTALSTMNLQLTANRAGGYNGIFVQGKGFTSDKQGFIYRVERDDAVSLVPVHWRFVGRWK